LEFELSEIDVSIIKLQEKRDIVQKRKLKLVDKRQFIQLRMDTVERISYEPSDMELLDENKFSQIIKLLKFKEPRCVRVVKNNPCFIRKFGSQGSGDGQLSNPWGVAIDEDGNIVVCDFSNHRIQVF